MGVRTLFVFTHDSIFVGEDGPTHQPIEHVDALRAIPGLTVFRPADGVETAMAYAFALQRAAGPVALALSRQKVAAVKREAPFRLEDVWRGAYAVRDPAARPHVVLLATGSEVPLARDAAARLSADGIEARVVSVPCVELFLARPAQERDALVPRDGTPLVAVEAGRGLALRGLVGPGGLVCGIDRFGASAPHTVLAEHFGFTPDALAARVKEFVGRR
jgi:transketolase